MNELFRTGVSWPNCSGEQSDGLRVFLWFVVVVLVLACLFVFNIVVCTETHLLLTLLNSLMNQPQLSQTESPLARAMRRNIQASLGGETLLCWEMLEKERWQEASTATALLLYRRSLLALPLLLGLLLS